MLDGLAIDSVGCRQGGTVVNDDTWITPCLPQGAECGFHALGVCHVTVDGEEVRVIRFLCALDRSRGYCNSVSFVEEVLCYVAADAFA